MRTKTKIRTELRAELDREHPDEGRVSELVAELDRARGGRPRLRRARGENISRETQSGRSRPDEVDQDAANIATWPPALRARLGRSPYSRKIDGRPVDDPGDHGRRNDLRRWSPWR